jgi:hypothetical protein
MWAMQLNWNSSSKYNICSRKVLVNVSQAAGYTLKKKQSASLSVRHIYSLSLFSVEYNLRAGYVARRGEKWNAYTILVALVLLMFYVFIHSYSSKSFTESAN